jgi:hypothetical protein
LNQRLNFFTQMFFIRIAEITLCGHRNGNVESVDMPS